MTLVDRSAQKAAAAEAALSYVQSGMTLGLGTGSTAEILVQRLGERMNAGLSITAAVATSKKTEAQGRALGLPMTTLDAVGPIDLCIDGADEVDPDLNLIKGGGGAHLREKIVASASKIRVIMVDGSKPVATLGAFGVPVEVIPFAEPVVKRALEQLGAKPRLRTEGDRPFVTDENNHIFDCDFGLIAEPTSLATKLSSVAGVVEHGLFCGMTEVLLVATADGVQTRVAPGHEGLVRPA